MPRLERGKRSLNFLPYGDPTRPPIVLLHDVAADARAWQEVASELAEEFHILAPDLAGHGKSSALESTSPSLTNYTADLVTLLDHVGLSTATFAGTGFGALVAVEMALEYPRAVTGLALADAALLPLPGDGGHAAYEDGLARAEDIARRFGMQALARAMAADIQAPFPASALLQRYRSLSSEGFVAALHARRVREDPTPRLANIHQPALVLTGEDGPLRRTAQHLADSLLHSRVETVPKVGLGAALLHSHTFARAVGDLLDRVAATP